MSKIERAKLKPFTSGDLPADFQTEEAVKVDEVQLNAVSPSITPTSTQYKIMGDTIYSDNDSIELFYFIMPSTDYTAITDTLDVKAYFRNLYRQMIIFMALNSDEYDTGMEQALMSRFEGIIMSIVGKRGNSNLEAVMPFMV